MRTGTRWWLCCTASVSWPGLILVSDGVGALYARALVYVGAEVHIRPCLPTKQPVLFVNEDISTATGTWTIQHTTSDVVREMVLGQVVLPGVRNNAGFDSLVLHETVDGKRHLLIIENKYSESDATTSLTWDAKKDGILDFCEGVSGQCVQELLNLV